VEKLRKREQLASTPETRFQQLQQLMGMAMALGLFHTFARDEDEVRQTWIRLKSGL